MIEDEEFSTIIKKQNVNDIIDGEKISTKARKIFMSKNNFKINIKKISSNSESTPNKILIKKIDIIKIFCLLKKSIRSIFPYLDFCYESEQTDENNSLNEDLSLVEKTYKDLLALKHSFNIRIKKRKMNLQLSKKSLMKIFGIMNSNYKTYASILEITLINNMKDKDSQNIENIPEQKPDKGDEKIYIKKKNLHKKEKKSGNIILNEIQIAKKMDINPIQNLDNLFDKALHKIKFVRNNKNEPESFKKYIEDDDANMNINTNINTNNINYINENKTNFKENKEKNKNDDFCIETKYFKKGNCDSKLITTQKQYHVNQDNFKANLVVKNYFEYTLEDIDSGPTMEISYKVPKNLLPQANIHHKKLIQKLRSNDNDNSVLYPFLIRKLEKFENYPVFLFGSIPELGSWEFSKAIKMEEKIRGGAEVYCVKNVLINKKEFPFEYKYFYKKNNKIFYAGMPKYNFRTHPQFFNLIKYSDNKTISILDFNIRYFNDCDQQNLWDFRKNKIIEILINSYADIFFFQEITKVQYNLLDKNLNSIYEFIGVYRDTRDESEKCPIAYNTNKFSLNDWGQFWLSSTPYEIGSNDFQNYFPRISTWASLRKLKNGFDCLFFNIHLDHVNLDAHMNCIKVVINESNKIIERYPLCKFVFLGGCFYCEENDPIISFIHDNGYKEVMFENSHHKFTGNAEYHWDYMFWKEMNCGGKFEVKKVKVLKEESIVDEKQKIFISDHFPIIVEFYQPVNVKINNGFK